MGYTITLTNCQMDTLTFDFDRLILRESDGLGMPPVNLLVQRGVTQDGGTFRDAYLDTRQVLLAFDVIEAAEEDLWDTRRQLSQFFSAMQSTCYLDLVDPSGKAYRLDVRFMADLTLPRAAGDDGPITQRVTLGLWAGDSFYDPVAVVAVLASSLGGTGMPIPMLMPMTLGSSTLDASAVIAYTGTWKAFPQVKLTGPLEDPVVTNLATNRVLDFTGTHIADGHYLLVDCKAKTVVDDGGVNQFATLTTDSDIGNFYLAAHPEVNLGDNAIHMVAGGVNANSKIEFIYNDQFIGV